jgi:hypothetical protein
MGQPVRDKSYRPYCHYTAIVTHILLLFKRVAYIGCQRRPTAVKNKFAFPPKKQKYIPQGSLRGNVAAIIIILASS